MSKNTNRRIDFGLLEFHIMYKWSYEVIDRIDGRPVKFECGFETMEEARKAGFEQAVKFIDMWEEFLPGDFKEHEEDDLVRLTIDQIKDLQRDGYIEVEISPGVKKRFTDDDLLFKKDEIERHLEEQSR